MLSQVIILDVIYAIASSEHNTGFLPLTFEIALYPKLEAQKSPISLRALRMNWYDNPALSLNFTVNV
jgi:hypothetical protein